MIVLLIQVIKGKITKDWYLEREIRKLVKKKKEKKILVKTAGNLAK